MDEYSLHKDFPQIKQYIYVSCDTPENIDKVKIALEDQEVYLRILRTAVTMSNLGNIAPFPGPAIIVGNNIFYKFIITKPSD